MKFRREMQSPAAAKRQPHVSYSLRPDGQEKGLAEKALGGPYGPEVEHEPAKKGQCPGLC